VGAELGRIETDASDPFVHETRVAHGALNLGMPKQELNGAQLTRAAIDQHPDVDLLCDLDGIVDLDAEESRFTSTSGPGRRSSKGRRPRIEDFR
jgi:hypothetical protein